MVLMSRQNPVSTSNKTIHVNIAYPTKLNATFNVFDNHYRDFPGQLVKKISQVHILLTFSFFGIALCPDCCTGVCEKLVFLLIWPLNARYIPLISSYVNKISLQ